MEKPRQPHIICYQRAWLTLLSDDRRSISGHLVQLSGRQMRMVLSEPVPWNAPVRLETSGWLALGEVCSCWHEYSHYMVILELDQMLTGLPEIEAGQREWINQPSQPPSFVLNVAKQPLS